MKVNSINNFSAVYFTGTPKNIVKIASNISSPASHTGAVKICKEIMYPNGHILKKLIYHPVSSQAKLPGTIAEGKKFNPNGTLKFEMVNPADDPYAIARQYDNNGFLKREKFIPKSSGSQMCQ